MAYQYLNAVERSKPTHGQKQNILAYDVTFYFNKSYDNIPEDDY